MMFYICKPHWVFCEPLGLSKTCCVCLLGFGMILTPAGQTERKLHISNVSAVCFLWLNWTSSCSLVFSFMEMLHYYHLLPPHPLYITAGCVCVSCIYSLTHSITPGFMFLLQVELQVKTECLKVFAPPASLWSSLYDVVTSADCTKHDHDVNIDCRS